ncbi:hypothetical protein OG596_38610 (plasmid) [Streptomyces sp. NBC_01102]|uniref:hypothetical protein n=1 Tax=Streptomyces sp. NBC_01102 TaxID=2903749 RepID=UPI002F91599F|nr:hypothetical protein OG596_38610 [Streptomyces sp. NBC_01102]
MTDSPFTDPTEAAGELARAMQAIGQASVHGPYEVEVRVRVIPARVATRQRQLRAEAHEALYQRTEPSPGPLLRPRPGPGR